MASQTDSATPAPDRPTYPSSWEADVVLSDGAVALVRPITPADIDGIRTFHAGQSAESIYLRFFAPLPKISDRDLRHFTHVDHDDRVALVVVIDEQIAGIGRYDRLPEPEASSAEVAFNVSDAHAGRGIASVLLEHLADIGSQRHIKRFLADVLPQNRKMLGVFRHAGYEVSHEFDDGLIVVSFDIEPTDRSRAVRLSREHRAESRSMRRVLSPDSVAVVGFSSSEPSLGRVIHRNIREGNFAGTLYAVGRRAASLGQRIDGQPIYGGLEDLPTPVDLVVVAVPADQVLDVVDQCGRTQTKALVVLSAGFADTGTAAGIARQTAVLAAVRARGMRLLGPNCFGMITTGSDITTGDDSANTEGHGSAITTGHDSANTAGHGSANTTGKDSEIGEGHSLNASLSPRLPPRGGLGIFTQSAALGIALLDGAERRDVGVSSFISAGNRCDISGNDLMQHWLDDDATTAVGLYLESIGNPRKFTRIARALASVKPVMVVASGISTVSTTPGQVTRSTRQRPQAFDAMLRQSGVMKVANAHHLFDLASLVTRCPLPGGQRVAIVSNSTALASLAAQACQFWHLDLAGTRLVDTTAVDGHATAVGGDATAVDGDATAVDGQTSSADDPANMFASGVQRALEDPDVDSVVTCFAPALGTSQTDGTVMQAVADVVARHDKPCATTFLGERHPHPDLATYPMPEDAVRTLAAATRHAQWRLRDHGWTEQPDGVNRRTAHNVIESFLSSHPDGGDLDDEQAHALLAAYGIDLWPRHPVTTSKQAKKAADRLNRPVVVKAIAPELSHEPSRRWVRMGLTSPEACVTAYRDLVADLLSADLDHLMIEGRHAIVVQAAAPQGTAVQIHTAEDPLFGPVVSFAVAGVPADLLSDVSYGFPPLRTSDIDDMITGIKAAPLLRGYRGAEVVDHTALHDLIARMSALSDDHPEITAARLNPVIAHASGLAVLGATLQMRPASGRAESERRSLSRDSEDS
ncbi:MAG: GNAT family N-acetyltransferase [Ornithinimicrobium sp.]